MSSDILARLEAVAARLEGYAAAVASGSAGHSSSSSAHDESTPRVVEDYDQFYQEAVVPVIEAANKSPDTQELGESVQKAWSFVRTVILASKKCKKPAKDADFQEFLKKQGFTTILDSGSKCSRKVPQNHSKAFPEAINSTTWFVQGGNARQFCQDQLETTDFYLIKILKEGKDSNKPEFIEFAQKLKALLQKQIEFVGDHFRGGLEWNPKGIDLSAFQDSKSGSSHAHDHGHAHVGAGAPPPPGPPGDYSSAPDAPPGPPPPGDYSAPSKPASGGTAGMGAVFAELTGKADSVTCGLKKVTKDMKQALKAAPVLEAKKKEVAPAKKWGAETKAAEVKKEPKTYLAKGTWFIENHENGEVVIDKVELKENVYVMKCKSVTVKILNKCKSIQIDGCVRTHVTFESVVSLAEIFNSQRCQLECVKTVPSVAIDKSAGCQIILSREGVATPPDIITSSVSELNLVVPGKTDEDDPIEIPLPEQYITKYKGGMTLATEPVTHGSNG